MGMIATLARGANDIYPALIAGLEAQFGCAEGAALVAHFSEAEAADFHWDARCNEHHLGSYEGSEDDEELERIAVIGCFAGLWYVATMIVDGDGAVHDMTRLQRFASAWDAEGAFADAV